MVLVRIIKMNVTFHRAFAAPAQCSHALPDREACFKHDDAGKPQAFRKVLRQSRFWSAPAKRSGDGALDRDSESLPAR